MTDSERFSLSEIALAANVLAKSIFFGNAAIVTGVDCKFLEKSASTATVTATVEGSKVLDRKSSVVVACIICRIVQRR